MPRLSDRGDPSRQTRGNPQYDDAGSSRRSNDDSSNRYKSRSKYTRSPPPRRSSPQIDRGHVKRDRAHTPDKFRTLCVKHFSAKLNIDAIQEYLFRDFECFGDVTISVGHLDGELAALISFKYSEDAREAYNSKPTVFLHDRVVKVEPLPENFDDDQPRSKVRRPIDPNAGYHLPSVGTGSSYNRRMPSAANTAGNLEANLAGIFAKSAVVGLVPPGGPSSLLGLPGLAPTAMMAAAARALGLTTVPPNQLPAPPAVLPSILQPPTIHGRSAASSSNSGGRRPLSPSNVDDTDSESKSTRTLFVGGLETDITEEEVQQVFESYGYIEHIDIKRSSKSGVYAYAFIRFENVDMACRARAAMSGHCVRSLHCKIGYGKPIPSTCLYIGALGSWITPDIFHRLLTRFGPVVQLDWPAGRSHAHVMFETVEAACEANNQLKGLPINNRSRRRLRVDFVDPEVMQSATASKDSIDFRKGSHKNNPDQDSSENSPDQYASVRHRSNEILGDNRIQWHSRHTTADHRRYGGHLPLGRGGTHRPGDGQRALSPSDASHLSLVTAVSLLDLDRCLQPDLFAGSLLLKSSHFGFRCLFVIGDSDTGNRVCGCTKKKDFSRASFRISQRGNLDPSWMAEATHRIYDVLAAKARGLCLLLLLPHTGEHVLSSETDPKLNALPLQLLIAYFKMKQAIGVVEPEVSALPQINNNDTDIGSKGTEKLSGENEHICNKLLIHILAPSSFALSLLKQAAPQLSSQLATADNYMVLLAIEPEL